MIDKINNHFRISDQNRWNKQPFVVGFEVIRSNNPNNECSICKYMAGKYPKSFRFVGWCNSCKCHIISILATEEERDKIQEVILNGEDLSMFKSVNEIKTIPINAIAYIRDNYNYVNNLEWFKINEELIVNYL